MKTEDQTTHLRSRSVIATGWLRRRGCSSVIVLQQWKISHNTHQSYNLTVLVLLLLFYFLSKLCEYTCTLNVQLSVTAISNVRPFFLTGSFMFTREDDKLSSYTALHVCSWLVIRYPRYTVWNDVLSKSALRFPISAVVAWSSVMYIVWNAHALQLLFHMSEADKASDILCEMTCFQSLLSDFQIPISCSIKFI